MYSELMTIDKCIILKYNFIIWGLPAVLPAIAQDTIVFISDFIFLSSMKDFSHGKMKNVASHLAHLLSR